MRPPPNARARRRAAGYTLVELLIVFAVIGALVSLAAPSAAGLRGGQAVRGARGEIVATVEAARGAAIQRGKPAWLVRKGNTLVAVAEDGTAEGYTVVATADLNALYGVTLTTPGAPAVLKFDARGLANPRLTTDVARYVVAAAGTTQRDSVCVSRLGLLLPRGCAP